MTIMKRFMVIGVMIAFCIVLTSCDSENVKNAKKAYEAENYPEVVSLLESEQDINDDVNRMLIISKAHVAYDEGDYLDAIKGLLSLEDGTEQDIYRASVKGLISAALASGDGTDLIKAIDLDPTIGTKAEKTIEKKCDALDYHSFMLLEDMIANLDNGKLKGNLEKYRETNKLNKPKAFLLGKWEWQSEGDKKTTVVCIKHKDNLIATVDVVGDNEKDYKIMKDDVYWKDFDFLKEDRFTCESLCKTGEGIGVECTTVGTVNYKDDSLHLHLTAPDPYWMDEESTNRDWKRVE